jgi:hypothetical protein
MGTWLRKRLSTIRIRSRTALGGAERVPQETTAGAFGRLAAGGLPLGLPKARSEENIGSKSVRQGRRLRFRLLPCVAP